MTFNYYIWKRLYDKGLKTKEDIENATLNGILTENEKIGIIGL